MARTVTPVPQVDDDGTRNTGTVWNVAFMTLLYDAINAVFAFFKPELLCLPAAVEATGSVPAARGDRNGRPVLVFSGTQDEEAVWTLTLPRAYGGGGLTIDIFLAFKSATSGTSRWQAALERTDLSSLDIDGDSFAAFQSAGVAAPGTSGQVVQASIALSDGAQMDSVAAGEVCRLKVRRDADGTSGVDDITSEAQVLAVVVRET